MASATPARSVRAPISGVTLPSASISASGSMYSTDSFEMNAVSRWRTKSDKSHRPHVSPDAAGHPATVLAADDDERPRRGEHPAESTQRVATGDVDDEVERRPDLVDSRRSVVDRVDGSERAHRRRGSTGRRRRSPGLRARSAICTAKLPTPPDAPMTRTRWPGRTRPTVVSACRAVMPEIVDTPACSTGTFAGRSTSLSTSATAYSAKAPLAMPITSSPTRNRPTSAPTATTRPATSAPEHRLLRSDDAEAGDPNQERQAGHQVDDAAVDARRRDLHDDLATSGLGHGDSFEVDDLRAAVAVLHGGGHRRRNAVGWSLRPRFGVRVCWCSVVIVVLLSFRTLYDDVDNHSRTLYDVKGESRKRTARRTTWQ